ncbi:unnamed protein product [Dibothriocephalus latus]|uniref:Uncharacterized protein n=1 Tax=Dibothriocephalus latus TaxID=60516 RepID=A0A3P6RGX7_DIBLA|nr:unnamed protein product [Dibothriocephalus latus]
MNYRVMTGRSWALMNNITPLHVAAKWGRLQMVKLLLDSGAIVDCRTRDGLTPLHCAARSGHTAVCNMLIDAGGNPSAKTRSSERLFLTQSFGFLFFSLPPATKCLLQLPRQSPPAAAQACDLNPPYPSPPPWQPNCENTLLRPLLAAR